MKSVLGGMEKQLAGISHPWADGSDNGSGRRAGQGKEADRTEQHGASVGREVEL